MRIRKNVVGQIFERLVVLGDATNDANGKRRLVVECDCGTQFIATLGNLRNGHTRSCGCLMRETSARVNLSHGGRRATQRSPVYDAWAGLIQRCTNPKSPNWPNYGGRGITVCDRWRDSFAAFEQDMGQRPSAAHSIDRKDNNGSYEPDNCRWATKLEQGRNRRDVRFLTLDDEPMSLRGLAGILAMPESSLRLCLTRSGVLYSN